MSNQSKTQSGTTTTDMIMAMFDHKDTISWLREARRSEISKPHFPIGWLPLSYQAALQELVNEKRVSVCELPARIQGAPSKLFVVKEQS